MSIDVKKNRQTEVWSKKEKIGRVLWALASPAFFLSPRLFWGWRNWMLRLFKAKIGLNVRIDPSVRITIPWNIEIEDYVGVGSRVHFYALGSIKVGKKATISQNTHLCAGSHDYRKADFPLTKSPIVIGNSAWICADSFIGPNVTVGEMAIVGARAVVTKNVEKYTIVTGNPARFLRKRPPQV